MGTVVFLLRVCKMSDCEVCQCGSDVFFFFFFSCGYS